MKSFMFVNVRDDRKSRDVKGVRSEVGKLFGDVNIQSVDCRHYADQSGHRDDHAEQREK
jgi:hypothetical protein